VLCVGHVIREDCTRAFLPLEARSARRRAAVQHHNPMVVAHSALTDAFTFEPANLMPDHGNRRFLCAFTRGPEKCNRAEMMTRPLKPCLSSSFSPFDFRSSLFCGPLVPQPTPFRHIVLHLLYKCERPCSADHCHDVRTGRGGDELNGFLIDWSPPLSPRARRLGLVKSHTFLLWRPRRSALWRATGFRL
jgi:hypothetical protein